MKPFIFTSSTISRILLRDHIIDLNREMNFEAIVTLFYESIKKHANNTKNSQARLIGLIFKTHSENDMMDIIRINLKRLNITFSHVSTDYIGGNESLLDWWYDAVTPDDYPDWAKELYNGEDYGPDNPSVNDNVNDQLRKLEEDGSYTN